MASTRWWAFSLTDRFAVPQILFFDRVVDIQLFLEIRTHKVCSELHARYTDAMWTVVWYELGWTSRCVRTESRLLQSADKSLITRI